MIVHSHNLMSLGESFSMAEIEEQHTTLATSWKQTVGEGGADYQVVSLFLIFVDFDLVTFPSVSLNLL